MSEWALLAAVNVTLAAAALVWLLLDLRTARRRMGRRRLYLTFALAGLLLSLLVGAAETLLHVNIRAWAALSTASCVWVLLGLWASRHDDKEIP